MNYAGRSRTMVCPQCGKVARVGPKLEMKGIGALGSMIAAIVGTTAKHWWDNSGNFPVSTMVVFLIVGLVYLLGLLAQRDPSNSAADAKVFCGSCNAEISGRDFNGDIGEMTGRIETTYGVG